MKSWVKTGLVVAAASAFAVVTASAPSNLVSAIFVAPGLWIAFLIFARLHIDFFHNSFAALCLAVVLNALIYSGLFGLLLWLLRPILGKSD